MYVVMLTDLALTLSIAMGPQQRAPAPSDAADVVAAIEAALRRYFANDSPDGPALADVLSLSKGHADALQRVLRSKSFVPSPGTVARHGVIDAKYHFVDASSSEAPKPSAPVAPDGIAGLPNFALLYGTHASGLDSLAVFVPDVQATGVFERAMEMEKSTPGRFVFLVPDEKQDNLWNPTDHEHRRHVGPLRNLLLELPIDPDRVYFVGSGRGGHATWDVGLTYAERFAGLFPCNGGLLHEGGYGASGGVFLENAKCLAIFTVFNTTVDHGIEGCRYAARKLGEWHFRIEAVEEQQFRTMSVTEAMAKLAPITRDPHPREIVKRFNHLDAGSHYWLEALTRVPHEWDPKAQITLHEDPPKDPLKRREAIWDQVRKECAFMKGSILTGNQIQVTTQGIGRLRIWFDPDLIDYQKKVTVTINGKARPPLTLSMDAATMLRRVHATGDTSRLYWASAEFGELEVRK
jgi:hypothetical protein